MKAWGKCILAFPIVLLLASGCSFEPYTLDNTVIGTVEEIEIEKKLFADDKFLIIREENHQPGNSLYTIPIDNNDNAYEVGQKIKVDIYSNTDTDDWNLNNLKFEIEVLEE